MCTVTIVPHGGGFRLVCNRDECRDRPAALPPAVHSFGTIHAAFPIDPRGGGTWIAVTTAGVAAALLNRTDDAKHASVSPARVSRGLIIPPLLESQSLSSAIREVRRLDAGRFAPFRLVLAHANTCALISSDGRSVSVAASGVDKPLMFTSSSLGDGLAWRARQVAFEQHVLSGADVNAWLEGQRRFHEQHWDDRPHLSVLMARADARTVSRTVVDVSSSFVRLAYEPFDAGAPRRVIAVGRAA